MNKQEVFEAVKKSIIEIIPELSTRVITLEDSLRELGANSIDRAEILIQTMSDLQVKIPLLEFGSAKNINDIVSVIVDKQK